MADDENDLHIGSEFYTCSLFHGYQSDVGRSPDVSYNLGELPIGEYRENNDAFILDNTYCRSHNMEGLQTDDECFCSSSCLDCNFYENSGLEWCYICHEGY